LYDSADGYAQARVLYLENRRFELRRFGRSGEVADDDYFDPYAETIDDNPEGYIDPYEDLE
jgi:phospholipid-binding lipoprotein MlaA